MAKKKTTLPKKSSRKDDAFCCVIKKAPAKHLFLLSDNRQLSDLRELAFALGDMSWDTFNHHVNDSRNDFANWVREIFKDEDLANALSGTRDKTQSQVLILCSLVKKA